jgi:hypothetical protein
MSFKIPLPVAFKKHHTYAQLPTSECPKLSLPNFSKSDFTDVKLIGQGSFGKVSCGVKDGTTFVIKELCDSMASSAEKMCTLNLWQSLLSRYCHNISDIAATYIYHSRVIFKWFSFLCFNSCGQ